MADSVTSGGMKTYLVGGAVRDKLLGIPVVDRDWVVVGETPQAMLDAGFTAVGKDFPVFLHPASHEEYALARTERKTGPGYRGFQFDTDVSVTLEEDLQRRDLTINAIAEDDDGKLVDPFNGQQDIEARVLRHVSSAFTEDPVRVLRIAKFMARFSPLGFDIANETLSLMQSMVVSGEVDNLVAERVWQELEASLAALQPRAFFSTLQQADALARVMPELHDAFARAPSNDAADLCQTKLLDALDSAATLSHDAKIRFAAMCASFTPDNAPKLNAFCQRLRAPSAFAELSLMCARFADQAHNALRLDATELHGLLKSLDAARRPERFDDFLVAVKADAIANSAAVEYPQAAHLKACAYAMNNIDAANIAKSQPNKALISTVIKQHEVAAIEAFLHSEMK